jgi:hypothetical protein
VAAVNEYLIFLLLGAIFVVVDGQVILRSGRAALADVYETTSAADGANRLVNVFFYLVMFGLLALVSTLDIGGAATLPRVVTKLGVLLLILAAGHAVATVTISSMRERQRQARRSEELALQRRQSPTVHPEPTELRPDQP